MRTSRAIGFAAILFVGLASSVSCATGASAQDPAAPSASPGASSPVTDRPTATAGPSPSPSFEGPTAATASCDSMLDPVVAGVLRSQGLSPAQKPWTQFGFTPSGIALECPWGLDGASVPDTFYGWAQLQPGQDGQFLSLVRENGYLVEQTPRGVWIVAPAELETDGSVEILVTPEWAAYAETRDAVDDIVWTK